MFLFLQQVLRGRPQVRADRRGSMPGPCTAQVLRPLGRHGPLPRRRPPVRDQQRHRADVARHRRWSPQLDLRRFRWRRPPRRRYLHRDRDRQAPRRVDAPGLEAIVAAQRRRVSLVRPGLHRQPLSPRPWPNAYGNGKGVGGTPKYLTFMPKASDGTSPQVDRPELSAPQAEQLQIACFVHLPYLAMPGPEGAPWLAAAAPQDSTLLPPLSRFGQGHRASWRSSPCALLVQRTPP